MEPNDEEALEVLGRIKLICKLYDISFEITSFGNIILRKYDIILKKDEVVEKPFCFAKAFSMLDIDKRYSNEPNIIEKIIEDFMREYEEALKEKLGE